MVFELIAMGSIIVSDADFRFGIQLFHVSPASALSKKKHGFIGFRSRHYPSEAALLSFGYFPRCFAIMLSWLFLNSLFQSFKFRSQFSAFFFKDFLDFALGDIDLTDVFNM